MSKTIYRCGCVAKDGQVKQTCVAHGAYIDELKSEEAVADEADA